MNTVKLDNIVARYEALGREISDPDVIADTKRWSRLCKEHTSLAPVAEKYAAYRKAEKDAEEARALLCDPDMKELAEEELARAEKLMAETGHELRVLLLPKDPDDGKSVVIEVRAGAGGEEAALFAAQLARMYRMFADSKGWKWEELSVSATELGGIKEASYSMSGADVYASMKFESGVHRVQRVPETETQGRIHTSTVTVAVLPEAEDVSVEISDKDLRIDTYRSSGAGGQHINKTDSAVRITHIPTGIVTSCQTQRSQTQNKEYAMRMLISKLVELRLQEQMAKAQDIKGELKKIEWGSQIRSYVFCPYTLVKDHRTGYETSNVQAVMDGNIFDFICDYLRKS